MVQTNDLRIGDYLSFKNVRSQVTAIDLNADGILPNVVADGNHEFVETTSPKVKGVKITTELLLEFGFAHTSKMSEKLEKWTLGSTNFIVYFNGIEAGLITSLPATIPCVFLHQLQNLYHSITGKELAPTTTDK
jgi:hypothetical protein